MPPVLQPGGIAGPASNIEAVAWPSGEWVFGRTRGTGLSIWQGVTAIRMRHIWDAPCLFSTCCPDDSDLMALQQPECWILYYGFFCGGSGTGLLAPIFPCTTACAPVPSCAQEHITCGPNSGCGVPGNFQTFTAGVPNLEMQALGFTVLDGTFVGSQSFSGTGGTVGPFTYDGKTFPANGGGGSNLQDVFGHSAWIGKWLGTDGIPLYVAVIGGAAPVAGTTPSAPGWQFVMGGWQGESYMQVFILAGSLITSPCVPAPNTITGKGPCFAPTGDVVTDICLRAGLQASQIDVSLLTAANIKPSTLVKGFIMERPTPAADVLRTLMQAYFFSGVETSGKMSFVPRGLASALTIPEADLGLVSDQAKLEEQWDQEQDLPQRFSITYVDPLYLYAQGKQEKLRATRAVHTKNQNVINIPMLMDPDWARQVSEKTLYLAWLERQHFAIKLGRPFYMLLDPTDVISFVYEGLTFTMRVVENSIGQGFGVELKGVNDNQNNYLSTAAGGGTVATAPPQTNPPIVSPTVLFLFDIPLLQDSDANPGGTGKYVAFSTLVPTSAAAWPGGQLFISSDDANYSPEGMPNKQAAVFGSAVGVLGNPSTPFAWDNVNTLKVRMGSSAFSFTSDTQTNVLNGSNMLIVGQEIVQFTTAVNNGDGTWTLSGLLRGRRGTEWACGFWGDFPNGSNTHANGDLVMQASAPEMPIGAAGVFRVDDSLALLNALRYYRGVTLTQDISTATSETLTITGADLKPYAPVQVGGSFDSFSDAIITWQRRSRIGGDGWGEGGDTLPLGEDSEAYDVEILNGSLIVRTVRVTTPTLVYTKAQMIADFGSLPASFVVNVYQISAQVGRGYKGHGVIPTANGLPEILPPDGGVFYVNGT